MLTEVILSVRRVIKERIAMPYSSITDLDEDLQRLLPIHAQEIYKEAFNSAFDQYDQPSERRGDDSREETVHKVTWSAVKKAGYSKNEQTGMWELFE